MLRFDRFSKKLLLCSLAYGGSREELTEDSYSYLPRIFLSIDPPLCYTTSLRTIQQMARNALTEVGTLRK